MSEIEQVFGIVHEYCHLIDQTKTETEADCCSVRWMTKSNYFPNQLTFFEFLDKVDKWPGDAEHLEGKIRKYHMLNCRIFALADPIVQACQNYYEK